MRRAGHEHPLQTALSSSMASNKLQSPPASLTSARNFVEYFPLSVQPYLRLMRLHQPLGSWWLLFWPCSWSIAIASEAGHFPSLTMLAAAGTGCIFMRGAGCTINDFWDKDIDKKVSRTKSRPIADGIVTRGKALVFLVGQIFAGLVVSFLTINTYTIVLVIASLPLMIVYPLMKRVTHWPQFVLGLAMNWGAFLGYSAIRGYCDWSVCLPLYAACVSWTLLYDTIYAYQDRCDDSKIGLKSTAILFKDSPKQWLTMFGTFTSLSFLLAGLNSSMSWPYYAGLGVASCHLAWQVFSLDITNHKDCLEKFYSNSHIGIIILVSIIASALVK